MRTIVWFIWFWVQLAVLQPLQRKGKKALQAGDDAAVDARARSFARNVIYD